MRGQGACARDERAPRACVDVFGRVPLCATVPWTTEEGRRGMSPHEEPDGASGALHCCHYASVGEESGMLRLTAAAEEIP